MLHTPAAAARQGFAAPHVSAPFQQVEASTRQAARCPGSCEVRVLVMRAVRRHQDLVIVLGRRCARTRKRMAGSLPHDCVEKLIRERTVLEHTSPQTAFHRVPAFSSTRMESRIPREHTGMNTGKLGRWRTIGHARTATGAMSRPQNSSPTVADLRGAPVHIVARTIPMPPTAVSRRRLRSVVSGKNRVVHARSPVGISVYRCGSDPHVRHRTVLRMVHQ
jgi:hypothetical protein